MTGAEDIIATLSRQLEQADSQNVKLNTALAHTSFQGKDEPNLIQYQLDPAQMLEKIEHFLRGDKVVMDGQGNQFWAKEVDEDKKLLNEYGVSLIMSTISNYIDKNTMLSFYDTFRINTILGDLGDELADVIYCNYEKIGLDAKHKESRSKLIVVTILHAIESAYRRALGGRTSEDLNTSKILTQLDHLGNNRSGPSIPSQPQFSFWKPSTWR